MNFKMPNDSNVFDTIYQIAKFLVEHEHSNEIKIDLGSMRLLLKIYSDPNFDNFIIGANSLYAKTCEISIREIDKDKSIIDFKNLVLQSIPIIAYRQNGEDYVLSDIESISGNKVDTHGRLYDFDVRFRKSKIAQEVWNQLNASKKTIEKFNL